MVPLKVETCQIEIGFYVVLVELEGLEVYGLKLAKYADRFVTTVAQLNLGWLRGSGFDFFVVKHVLQWSSEFNAISLRIESIDNVTIIFFKFILLFFDGNYLCVQSFCLVIPFVLEEQEVGLCEQISYHLLIWHI